MKYLIGLLAACLFAGSSAATNAAPDTAPDVLVRNVTNEVLEIVRKDKDIQAGNTKKPWDWLRPRCCRTSIFSA